MYSGKLVFTQVMDPLPWHGFRRCVARYRGNHKVKSFTCADQYRCMAFAQLTCRSSLRDIEACLRVHPTRLCHMGIRGRVSRNTLAHANAVRGWQIHADFAQRLIHTARRLHADDNLPGLDLGSTIHALDSSTIDLCLSLFPWAPFRSTRAAVKRHTLLDLHGSIPAFIHVSDGKLHDVNVMDMLLPEAGAFHIMDRACLDFRRLHHLHRTGSFFVLRARSNTRRRRLCSRPVDRTTGLICDQVVRPSGVHSAIDSPDQPRRIRYRDVKRGKTLVFLTNNLVLPALTITELCRARWHVELFFKRIRQHLRIKSFFGTSENAVKTQIWIAVSVFVLVAIIRKRLNLEQSLYTILQIPSLSRFEKTLLDQLFDPEGQQIALHDNPDQLNPFG